MSSQETVTTAESGLTITKDRLRAWQACSDGYAWFLKRFPQGGGYREVQAALREDRRFDDARWLTEKAFAYAMAEPAATRGITADSEAEVLALIEAMPKNPADTDSGHSARIGSSGHYARIGSSGDSARIGSSGGSAQIGSSGHSAQIGSSGVSAQIGSSGHSARIGSSGHSARINAIGGNAVIAVAGPQSRVRAGDNGAVAVAYNDGKRVRFAVGYVGENLKPMTWYSVNDKGEFVEVQE